MSKPNKEAVQILLGLILVGGFFLFLAIPSDLPNTLRNVDPNDPVLGILVRQRTATNHLSLYIGVLAFFGGIAGFVALHLARQSNSENSIVQTFQETVRPFLVSEEPSTIQQLPETVIDEDQRRADQARERYKLDIVHKVDLEAGREIYTHESLERWKTRELARLKSDNTLAPDARTDLVDAVHEAYFRQLKKLHKGVSVYEEE